MRPAPVEIYTPWGNQPANDNASPVMLGLTGRRNVGKSTFAELLEAEYGFARIHPFEGGKSAAAHWFDYIGGDGQRMVYGDQKDRPSDILPGGVSPRYFLEKFGKFMGAELGTDWTLGMEVRRAQQQNPGRPIVIESIVYEAPWFRAQGGRVVRLERPGHVGPAGIESDAVQALLDVDRTVRATTLAELRLQARRLAQEMVGGR